MTTKAAEKLYLAIHLHSREKIMNDFTKEELERINYILKQHDFREAALINKLQAMIDDYCDHEFDHELHSVRDELPLVKTVCSGEVITETQPA